MLLRSLPLIYRRRGKVPNKPRAASPPPPPPPAVAHVVDVGANGTNLAIWSFDREIVSLTDATGLACPASGAVVSASVSGTTTVAVEYESEVHGGGGDVWECTAADVTMTFADGATLQDGTGFIAGS